jgi:hypothetical protein
MDLSIAHCRSASTRARWSDNVEKRVVLTEIPPEHKAFIESMDMFFLSTIDHQGRPTVSYKGVSNENKKTNGGFSESGAIAAKHARYSWGERWRNNALFATLAAAGRYPMRDRDKATSSDEDSERSQALDLHALPIDDLTGDDGAAAALGAYLDRDTPSDAAGGDDLGKLGDVVGNIRAVDVEAAVTRHAAQGGGVRHAQPELLVCSVTNVVWCVQLSVSLRTQPWRSEAVPIRELPFPEYYDGS